MNARGTEAAVYVANRLPYPLDDGWKVRAFHVLRGVAAAMPTTLVAFHGDPGDRQATELRDALDGEVAVVLVRPPRPYTPGNLIRGLVSDTPVHVWNQRSDALRSRLADVLRERQPTVAVSASTFMFPYLAELPPGIVRIIDTHNVDSVTFGRYARTMTGVRRLYARVTARKLKGFERRAYAHVDAVWVCSDGERDLILRELPGARVSTIPNGVDTRRFAPDPSVRPDPDSLLFFGRLDYFPNIDGLEFFLRDVLPRIAAKRRVRLRVAGPAAGPGVTELLAGVPDAELVGAVPDIRRELASAAVVVVPLRVGGGTRLKILESLAMGRPTVSTTVGAEGIELGSGRDLLLADTADTFADAVCALLADPERATRLGQAGRRTVEQAYDWDAIGRDIGRSIAGMRKAV